VGGGRHRDRIIGVARAAVADREDPHPGGQLGRHVQDRLAVASQPLRQGSADAVGALDRPAALRPAPGPLAQLLVAVQGRGDTLLTEQAAVLVEGGGGVGALWGSTPMVTGMRAPFLKGGQENTGRADRLWAGQTAVEPLPVRCRQDRTTVLEPTRPRVAVAVVERPASTWNL
jgi:hypothetical protein